MQRYQLTLKDDLERNNDVQKEGSIRINKTALKEEGIMYNPVIHVEMKRMRKHHSVIPMMKDDSKVEIKTSTIMEIDESKKNKKFIGIGLKNGKTMISEIKQIKSVKKVNECYRKIEKFLNSNSVIIIMAIFTIFALFASDIQALCLPRSVDVGFDCVQCFLLAAFTAEIVLSSIVKDDYLWSFFFWLDVIATISLIQDISFIFDYLLTGTSSLTPPEIITNSTIADYNKQINYNNNNDQAIGAIQKVSSASRATRVLRIIRIIRLIRIVKLYKTALLTRAKMEKRKKEKERIENFKTEIELSSSVSSNNNNRVDTQKDEVLNSHEYNSPETMRNMNLVNHETLVRIKNFGTENTKTFNKSSSTKDINKEEKKSSEKRKKTNSKKKKIRFGKTLVENFNLEEMATESKIGKILTESITKKVIILIIGMLVILPIVSDDFFQDDSMISYTILAKYISNYWYTNGVKFFDFKNEFTPPNMLIGKFMNGSIDENFPIITIEIEGKLLYHNISWVNYTFRHSELKRAISDDGLTQVKYSNITETQLSAALNIGRTIFVCICLALAAIYFEKDTQDLVLEPLEVMIEIVDSVAKDPINAKNVENLRKGLKSTVMKIEKKQKKKELTEEKYEVKVIERAIIKISALLAIGFGEAGGEIIKENLNSGNELNPMLKGKKKTAIFGFCDIRNFSQVNELLQEKTIVFVNQIAEIVHSCVDKFGGAANKNMGDAFLVVWKFKMDNDPLKEILGSTLALKKQSKDDLFETDPLNPLIQRTADMSVLGFLSILVKINKDLKILSYRNDEKINRKIKNYKVRMGFGLHMGWAIEGAIGSSYKIDASYLSPNVNMAARLEAATKIYGVSILISNELFDQLSNDLKDIFRLVDRVTVKGSREPINLYTIDLNLNITPEKVKSKRKMNAKMLRDKYQFKKQKILSNFKLYGITASKTILNKKSFREILNTKRGRKFYSTWDEGLELYFSGDWENAANKFSDCLKMVGSDGPCTTLLKYLKSNNYKAPDNWKGVRELTSKT